MNWDYLAGFFDGEGHTGASRSGRCWRFRWQVTQKDPLVLEQIRNFLHARGYTTMMLENRTKSCSVLSLYRVGDVERILKKMRPKLIVKADQADKVLAAIRDRPRKGQFWGGRPSSTNKSGAKLGRNQRQSAKKAS